ncbi:MAG: hypothetical protein V2A54_12010, partial [Bacteroidota bacterium]
CKKGENDPMFSLKSRKARLAGEWELSEGSVTTINSGSSYTYSYNGTTCTETSNGTTDTYPYTETISYNKDGSFEKTTTNDGNIYAQEGYWTFGSKVKEIDLKNKESVIVRVTSTTNTISGTTTTTTYEGTQCPVSEFVIDELSSKKMVRFVDGSYVGGSSLTQTGTKTFEKK